MYLSRSSQCFPLERCSLGTCVEQTVQDIMYNGVDYSMKLPGDEEDGEANDTSPEKGTGSDDAVDLEVEDSSSDPHYTHVLKYPETSALEDCLFVVKWGGEPGAGKVDFEIRSKRKAGIVGFFSSKETVSFILKNTLSKAYAN